MAEMSPLRRRMIEDMTVRNLSPATQRSYLYAVTKFSRYFSRSPDRLNVEDVRAFQVHLVSTGISWPALNQTVCALRFFYGVTLGQAEIPERIPYAREPRKLPVVLNADEVVRFLEAVASLKTRTALTTAYAAGLRVSEAVGLKVCDIDSGRMVIRVEHGKGGATAQDPANLLAVGPPQALALSRSGREQANRRPGAALFLPLGLCRSGLGQARDGAYAAPQLRHPSAGERRRYPHHPGAAGSQQPLDHGALYAGLERLDPADREPARPADAGGRAARLSRRGHGSAIGDGGCLAPPRRHLSP